MKAAMSLNFQSYWYTYCVQARGRLYRARYCLYKRTRKPYSYRAETRRLLRRSYEASAERCNFCRCPAGLARACESLLKSPVSSELRQDIRHTTHRTMGRLFLFGTFIWPRFFFMKARVKVLSFLWCFLIFVVKLSNNKHIVGLVHKNHIINEI